MKKLISILLLSGMVLSLNGCVSQKDYKDLEKRVEYLEQQHNIQQTTYSENQSINNIDITETSIRDNVWSLDSMSADEIYNECITLSKSIKTGDNISVFQNAFKTNPLENNQNTYFLFDSSNQKDCISSIGLQYLLVEMNDTYTIKKDSKIIFIIHISDYNTAAEFYDKIYTYLTALNYEKFAEYGNNDNRQGSSWQSNIQYERVIVDADEVFSHEEYYITDECVYCFIPRYNMYMNKIDNSNYFEIKIELPIISE